MATGCEQGVIAEDGVGAVAVDAPAKESGCSRCVAEWTDRRLEIEAGEPRILRVLDTICYNEMLRAMDHQRRDQIPIGFWQRCFAHFFDFREHRLHAPAS